MTREQKRLLAVVVVPIQLLVAVLAWRDMASRTDQQVRGRKIWWRLFILLNPGNSFFYWLFGRC